MSFLIKISVIVFVLAMGSFVYAESVMKEECKAKYSELNQAKSDAQKSHMKSKRSLRTKLGKADSEYEVKDWEAQDTRITDDYNRKMEGMEQEMQSIYNNPSCWE